VRIAEPIIAVVLLAAVIAAALHLYREDYPETRALMQGIGKSLWMSITVGSAHVIVVYALLVAFVVLISRWHP